MAGAVAGRVSGKQITGKPVPGSTVGRVTITGIPWLEHKRQLRGEIVIALREYWVQIKARQLTAQSQQIERTQRRPRLAAPRDSSKRRAWTGFDARADASPAAAPFTVLDIGRVRALLFAYTLAEAMYDQCDALDTALTTALDCQRPKGPPHYRPPPPASPPKNHPTPQQAAAQTVPPANSQAGQGKAAAAGSVAAAKSADSPSAPGVEGQSRMREWPWGLAWLKQRAGCLAGTRAWLSTLDFELLQILLAWPVWDGLRTCLLVELPLWRTAASRASLFAGHTFQASIKSWMSSSLVLVLILAMSASPTTPEVARFPPLYGFIAAALTFHERVESTISRITLWLAGNLVGGLAAYGVMSHPVLATNPYALMAFLCVGAFVGGLAAASQFRIAVGLGLMTYSTVILCQYKGCCDHTGSGSYVLARMLSVALGCLLPLLLTHLLKPWYTSQFTLRTLSTAFTSGTRLLQNLYHEFHSASQAWVPSPFPSRTAPGHPHGACCCPWQPCL
ncbi:hypothetical protein V8C86DRAFT_1303234 [Haematococcus lacustris]